VLAPLSWNHDDDEVRLGRRTEWQGVGVDGQAPIGQKLFLVDDEEFPVLELRELDIVPAPVAVG
jgi:type VI secretion system protein ImpE